MLLFSFSLGFLRIFGLGVSEFPNERELDDSNDRSEGRLEYLFLDILKDSEDLYSNREEGPTLPLLGDLGGPEEKKLISDASLVA